MVELRVVVSDELAEELARRARAQQTTAEELASEVLESLGGHTPHEPRDPLGFVGMFDSGESDIARRVDEILRGEPAA